MAIDLQIRVGWDDNVTMIRNEGGSGRFIFASSFYAICMFESDWLCRERNGDGIPCGW